GGRLRGDEVSWSSASCSLETGVRRASHGMDFRAPVCWRCLRVVRLAGLVRFEEVEHESQGEEIAAYVQLLRALRIHLRAGEGIPVLDHQRERPRELVAQSERDVTGGGVGLVADAVALAGVQRIPDPPASIEREGAPVNQRGVEREEHGDGLDLEVAARDPVTVPEVSDLDLEVQLLVVLVAKGSEAAGLQRPVRRELLGQV